jgi:integrase
MTSSGIRVGAWDYLRWKHVKPIEKNGNTIAAKLIVYPGENEEYFTFITPEAYFELEKWKEYRIQSGELVDDNSWIMRNIWNTKKGYTRGLVTVPVKLQSEGVKRLIEDALWTQGIRKKLEPGKKRHEFQTDHGFRKWYETRCLTAGMKPINVKVLMDHSIGISDSYYRIPEDELLEDYMKAVPFLMIYSENQLRLENEEIKQRNDILESERDQVIALRKELEPLIALKNTLIKEGILKEIGLATQA